MTTLPVDRPDNQLGTLYDAAVAAGLTVEWFDAGSEELLVISLDDGRDSGTVIAVDDFIADDGFNATVHRSRSAFETAISSGWGPVITLPEPIPFTLAPATALVRLLWETGTALQAAATAQPVEETPGPASSLLTVEIGDLGTIDGAARTVAARLLRKIADDLLMDHVEGQRIAYGITATFTWK